MSEKTEQEYKKRNNQVKFFIGLILVVSWLVNVNKLTECDFNAPYRCEFLHGIGLHILFAPIMAWAEVDND